MSQTSGLVLQCFGLACWNPILLWGHPGPELFPTEIIKELGPR